VTHPRWLLTCRVRTQASDTLAVGDSADAASTTPPIRAAHVTTQTVLKKVKGSGKGKLTCVVLGPKVSRVDPGAFAGSPINRVQVKSGTLAKKANVLNCLKGSGVKRVEVLRDAGTKLKRESVAKAFKTWADPSRSAKLDGYVVAFS